MGERGLTIVELLVVVVIIAAIGIPALLRARVSANESATIGDIRSVVSAEATTTPPLASTVLSTA